MANPARGERSYEPSASQPHYRFLSADNILLGGSPLVGGAPGTAIPDLTGAVGTANNAMAAIPAVAAAPADVAALATELNATTIPAINNDLADLQAKMNALLAAARAKGIILP